MPSICSQNFKSKFESLKIDRLILCIPLNTIENGIGFNETFVETCSFHHSALLENTIAANCWVRTVCNKC